MAHPHFHSKSSAKTFGGISSDYEKYHNWMDQYKAHMPDCRARAILHHSAGIFLGEQMFGLVMKNSDGKDVPIREILQQHILEDFGHIPTIQDWLEEMPIRPWMYKKSKKLSKNPTLQ